jgi:hypothetical protein
LSVLGGGTHPSLSSPKVVLVAAVCGLLVAGVGCGEESGVAEGATVTAYVAAPLCGEAKRELGRQGERAGDVSVRVLCLPAVESDGQLNLAAVGANARRATEDSTTVGYLEPPGPASRFSRPILEEAGIASIQSSSGKAAMARLLAAIREADSSSLRDSVHDALS